MRKGSLNGSSRVIHGPVPLKKRSAEASSPSNVLQTRKTWLNLKGATLYSRPWYKRAHEVPQKASVTSNHWNIVQAGRKFVRFYAQSVPMIVLLIVAVRGAETTASLLSLWARWWHGLVPSGLTMEVAAISKEQRWLRSRLSGFRLADLWWFPPLMRALALIWERNHLQELRLWLAGYWKGKHIRVQRSITRRRTKHSNK